MTYFHTILKRFALPPISVLLHALVNQYLSDSNCLTLVLDKPIDFNVDVSFTVHYNSDNCSVDELTAQFLEVSEKGCSDYIVYMSDPRKFLSALEKISHKGNTRRSDRKIIFLPYSSDPEHINRSLELFYMKESTFVANLLLILPNSISEMDCELYDLITHEFVDIYNDQPLYLDQWDSCTQKYLNNVNLFPHDLQDLKGRIVRVACFTYKPYSFLNLDKNVIASQRDGVEVRIVEEFCRWVNCTIELVQEEINQWGEIYDNGTGVGILGDVAEDRADMGISALYSWYEEYLFLDFSAPVVRSAVTCVAPSPRVLASWEMPLMPFSWYMWYAVIFTFIFASIGLIVAKGSSDKVFLTIFGMMISQSQKDRETWRIRGITGWMLGASLILVSAYGAGLASTFTVPKYEASIDTVEDLVERGMEWGATHDAWIFSITLSSEHLVQQLVSQFRIFSAEELKRRSFTRDMAFSIEKLPAGSFAVGDYITKEALQDLTLMLENFYYEQCVIMMRKSSVYTEKISELVGRLHASGLLLSWETQVSLKYLNFEVQQALKLSRSSTSNSDFTTALDLHHVIGVYGLYLTGVVIATLVFLGEYIFGNVARRTVRQSD